MVAEKPSVARLIADFLCPKSERLRERRPAALFLLQFVIMQRHESKMRLDFDIRFDLKSISSHAWRRCCSQPGASLEIDFKFPKGGMSRHNQGLKIDFKCFLGAFSKGNLKLTLSLPFPPHCY